MGVMWQTGNNTPAPQWVYIGIHIYLLFGFIPIPNPLLFKWGIGGSWLGRLKGVSGTIPGFVLPIFLVYIPLAWHIEQWGHRQLKFINVPYIGSGKTEWFIIIGVLFAIPVLALVAFPLYLALLHALVYIVFGEIVAQNALKWVITHPLATVYLIAMCKVMVISGQIVLYRSNSYKRRLKPFVRRV